MEEEKKERREEIKKEAMEWVKSIGLAVIIAMIIKTFIFNTTFVKGNSMYPTLHQSDRLFANKLPLYFEDGIKRGDMVLIDAPDDGNKKYIKRVVALEGDTVEILGGEVYLNGEKLEEKYLESNSYTETYDIDTWVIKDGEVFLLGDNRKPGASKDSRYFGPVSRKSVIGIAKYRFFPFSRFGKIDKL